MKTYRNDYGCDPRCGARGIGCPPFVTVACRRRNRWRGRHGSRIWQKGEAMIRARDLEEVRGPTQ
jgi:hypothetical protein